ncbi:MAG: hypothetical protein AMS27_10070 [Bacteroides sp. SM23_62_1]|nr:MAG: hypothetical protein AMS27_10070 [Bacteroides sp. SM23_62_1]
MGRITAYLCVAILLSGLYSCEEVRVEPGFEDTEQMTILDYIAENEEDYSSFMQILKAGGIDRTMSAYNPDGLGYTLFLPDNNAIDRFIEQSNRFSSLNDLLNDLDYVYELSRYHIVNIGINSNDFPFGALPDYTLSGDYLTVSFVIETDTSYYVINNQAPVIKPDIELSNGYIHIINNTLIPITFTSYEWFEQHEGFTIFKDLIDATGLQETIDINLKDETNTARPFTLLIEPDSVYHKRNINSLDDLAKLISPDNSDYTNLSNPLYNFATYHILAESKFLNDFIDIATNYITYSEIPLNINGKGLDIMINKGKEVFDTIIDQKDTVIIDYVGFYYDESNIITQSGAIHFINQVLKQQRPSRAIQTFEFYEEPLLNEYRQEQGLYLIEDTSWLNVIKWSGTDLFFVETRDDASPAWGGDYLFMDGDFVISYTFPKIIQGKYTAYLGADAYSWENALIEVFIDGKKTGTLINLASGGTAGNPFAQIDLGTINFLKYEEHTVEIRSLIPGRFLWDYIRFEPE